MTPLPAEVRPAYQWERPEQSLIDQADGYVPVWVIRQAGKLVGILDDKGLYYRVLWADKVGEYLSEPCKPPIPIP